MSTAAKKSTIGVLILEACFAALGAISAIIIGVAWFNSNYELMFWALLLLFFTGIVPGMFSPRKHVVLLAFGASYFTFIFSRIVVVNIFNYRTSTVGLYGTHAPTSQVLCTALGIHAVFLTVALAVYWIVSRKPLARLIATVKHDHGASKGRRSQTLVSASSFVEAVRQVAKFSFYLSLFPYLLHLTLVGRYVYLHGYYMYYQRTSSVSPGIISLFDEAMFIAFVLYLATRPPLRELVRPTVLFVVFRLFSLVSMERNSALLPILAVAILIVVRIPFSWSILRNNVRRLSIIAAAAITALVGGLWGLSSIDSSRGTGGRSVGIFTAPLEFFYGQGYSINIAIISQLRADVIPAGRWYSFGPVIEFFQTRIGPIFSGDQPFLLGNNVQRALHGHQFAHSISYAWAPKTYVKGSGIGSSAPVELWFDAGFIGVALGAAFYGLVLYVLGRWLRGKVWQIFLSGVFIRGLLFSPRASFLEFLATFNAKSMLSTALILALSWLYWRYWNRVWEYLALGAPRHRQ